MVQIRSPNLSLGERIFFPRKKKATGDFVCPDYALARKMPAITNPVASERRQKNIGCPHSGLCGGG